MFSTPPPTSKSSNPVNNTLVTVPKSTITIGIIVIFMSHSFFQLPTKVLVLILFTFFQFYSVVSWNDLQFGKCFFLLLIIISSGLLTEIR